VSDMYSSGDTAALLVMLLRCAQDKVNPVKGFNSFWEQIDASKGLSPNPDFAKALAAMEKLKKDNLDKEHLIDAAHYAIRDLLLELHNTGAWGVCKLVEPTYIKRLAELQSLEVVLE
jgi:hypothetical protein